jgi:hypothetical protein
MRAVRIVVIVYCPLVPFTKVHNFVFVLAIYFRTLLLKEVLGSEQN